MESPLVTIVVAAYATRLEQFVLAIDSACAQTHTHLEILVGDDSPDDRLGHVVAQRNDRRLQYEHHVPPLGVAGNHWAALHRARGEFVVVLNHDDWLAPEFVETMVAVLQESAEAVLSFCDHWIIDAGGQRQMVETERTSAAWGRSQLAAGLHRPFGQLLVAQTIPMAMGTMFRRSALPTALPAHAGAAYDLWLTYLLARTGGGAYYVPRRLSAWRSHAENQTTLGALSWLHGAADCWQAAARDNALAGVHSVVRSKAAGAYGSCALRCWRDRRLLDCVRFALSSVRAQVTLRGLGMLLLPLLPPQLGVSIFRRRAQ